MSRNYQQGDTLIEVVLAFGIFTLAAMTTMSLINSGLATTQRSLEITLVRQQIDAQGEMLRYLRDTNNSTWTALISNLVNTPLSLQASCQEASTLASASAFYVRPTVNDDPSDTTFTRQAISSSTFLSQPETYAKIDYSSGAAQSQGIWIQAAFAQQKSGSTVKAYDFYIHACWQSVGVSTPMTLGTIVRIYE